jgi:hypothetical protein
MNKYNSSCCFFLPLWAWLEILIYETAGRLSWKGSRNSSRSLPHCHFCCLILCCLILCFNLLVFLYLQTKYTMLLYIYVTLLRSNVGALSFLINETIPFWLNWFCCDFVGFSDYIFFLCRLLWGCDVLWGYSIVSKSWMV